MAIFLFPAIAASSVAALTVLLILQCCSFHKIPNLGRCHLPFMPCAAVNMYGEQFQDLTLSEARGSACQVWGWVGKFRSGLIFLLEASHHLRTSGLVLGALQVESKATWNGAGGLVDSVEALWSHGCCSAYILCTVQGPLGLWHAGRNIAGAEQKQQPGHCFCRSNQAAHTCCSASPPCCCAGTPWAVRDQLKEQSRFS